MNDLSLPPRFSLNKRKKPNLQKLHIYCDVLALMNAVKNLAVFYNQAAPLNRSILYDRVLLTFATITTMKSYSKFANFSDVRINIR